MAKIQTAATYFGWQTLLGNRHERKIGNNTIIRAGVVYNSREDQTGEPAIEVCLHGNRIAAIRQDDSVQLWDGGWRTATTKERLNKILRAMCANVGIYQKDFDWYLQHSQNSMYFMNSMIIQQNGGIVH